jgi:RND family efflux transporter MFP subunit
MTGMRWISAVAAVLALLAGPVSVAEDSPGFVGVLLAPQAVELTSSLEGRLREVHVAMGDAVERGQLIASIDDLSIRQELATAQAELEEARASGNEAETRLALAAENLQRREAAPEAFSAEKLSQAEKETELAEAGLEVARARVRRQEALLLQLQDKLKQTRIVSPFAGTIATRYRDPGMMVGAGRPVARLISLGLHVRFAVPVDSARVLAEGEPVSVAVTSLDLSIPGTIDKVSSEVDPASAMIFCEATVEAPAGWTGPPLAGRDVRVLFGSSR